LQAAGWGLWLWGAATLATIAWPVCTAALGRQGGAGPQLWGRSLTTGPALPGGLRGRGAASLV
jgi:hypothetical protein